MNCTEINKQTGQVKCIEFTDDSIRQDLSTCSGHCVPPHLFQNNTEHLYFAIDSLYRFQLQSVVEMISTCRDPDKAVACESLEEGDVDGPLDRSKLKTIKRMFRPDKDKQLTLDRCA